MTKSTTDITIALRGGYIGETVLIQTKIAKAIRSAYGMREIKPITVFYYGERNDELDELFGYRKKQE